MKIRLRFGTLLDWLNGNPIAQPVSITRAISIVLRDEYDIGSETHMRGELHLSQRPSAGMFHGVCQGEIIL